MIFAFDIDQKVGVIGIGNVGNGAVAMSNFFSASEWWLVIEVIRMITKEKVQSGD
jgi:hypothetical protein